MLWPAFVWWMLIFPTRQLRAGEAQTQNLAWKVWEKKSFEMSLSWQNLSSRCYKYLIVQSVLSGRDWSQPGMPRDGKTLHGGVGLPRPTFCESPHPASLQLGKTDISEERFPEPSRRSRWSRWFVPRIWGPANSQLITWKRNNREKMSSLLMEAFCLTSDSPDRQGSYRLHTATTVASNSDCFMTGVRLFSGAIVHASCKRKNSSENHHPPRLDLTTD